jgi:hypothetical protein
MPKAPARGAITTAYPLVQIRSWLAPGRIANRRSTSVATITGQRARSTLPACDTPGAENTRSGGSGSVPRADLATVAWRSVTPSIAGSPHVRISRDGGRTYPARHARPLPDGPPGQPCTVPVYDPGSATGRMLALDLDPARADRDVDDAAVQHRHEHRAAEVRAQAEALAAPVARCGGQVLADVAPSGGRHVFILFAAALPWLELRDVARALALRYPSIDTVPMSSLGGQISPPGSGHKSGGWRVLSTSVDIALAAVEHPNGPELWAALLAELAAELRQVETCTAGADSGAPAELDDTGVPWVPRLGGRASLGAELEHVAGSGRWDRSHYAGRSEARMAVLGAAAARGWRLADVQSAIASEAWKGLAALYERRSEPGRMERLLPLEWRKCTGKISGEKNVRPLGASMSGLTRRVASARRLASARLGTRLTGRLPASPRRTSAAPRAPRRAGHLGPRPAAVLTLPTQPGPEFG